MYDALVPLSPARMPMWRSADVLRRMVADVEAIQDLMIRVVVPAGTAVVVGVVAVGFTTWLLPVGGAVLTLGLALAGVVVPLLTLAIARRSASSLAPARADLAAASLDLLQGSADLAVFGATERALKTADAAADRVARLERRSAFAASSAGALGMVVQGAATVGVAAIALDAAASGALAAVMVPVLALVALISFEPVLALVPAARQYLESRESARRVLAVLDASVPPSPASGTLVPAAGATIELRGLSARYPGSRPRALDEVDLTVAPGTRVAVVGPSGSGKSTLLAVLMRFVEPESGSFTIDGRDAEEYDDDTVRAFVTGVTQDAHLFHTTIRENLRLARPDAADDELRAALEAARVLDWVESLPRGLDTAVGEHGAQVSGGQRQRLVLARALLADPPVLVLDEPTEGLEPDTADEIMADLLSATTGRTTIIVTHRLAGLDTVDEVVVIDAGRVVQRGRHAELAVADGPYRELLWASDHAAPRLVEG